MKKLDSVDAAGSAPRRGASPFTNPTFLRFETDEPPVLVVVIDTEEEFSWGQPFSQAATAVDSIANLGEAHRVFVRHGVRPTYVVDFPVASQPAGYLPLREWVERGECDIGAHLQPWVNPPLDEEICDRNSFPCNLPRPLEQRKLEVLTTAIMENLGVIPAVYKAGRYGIGSGLEDLLLACGYGVDVSLFPLFDFSEIHGRDFRDYTPNPFWFGRTRRLLEVPMTAGHVGMLRALKPWFSKVVDTRVAMRAHLPGLLSRSRLFERVVLSPEGWSINDHRNLTRALLQHGQRVFSYTFHSPSLTPGCTPYVASKADRASFLGDVERYLDYFLGAIGGISLTARELAERHRTHDRAPAVEP